MEYRLDTTASRALNEHLRHFLPGGSSRFRYVNNVSLLTNNVLRRFVSPS